MALLNFNAADVAPAAPREAIPAGWYTVAMVKSEVKPTKDGSGSYLETEYEVLAPAEFAKASLYDRINLQNKNPVAVEIGYRTLSAICHAVNVIQVQDSSQLHNKPLEAKVKLRAAGVGADGKNYEASNEIDGYRAAGNQQTTQVAPPPVAPPPVYNAGDYASKSGPDTNPGPVQQPWQQAPAQQAAPIQQPWQQPPVQQTAPVQQAPVQQAAPQAGSEVPPWQR